MIKIDLGCGKEKPDGYIGVDIIKNNSVDIVHNCEKGLPFDNDYADEIRSWDFLEHISRKNVIHIMNEIWRVLKPGGKFIFKVPDAERGPGAFQDPTHKSFWVINSFKYYENTYYQDSYGIKAHFKIDEIRSTQYLDENHYWGPNTALFGTMTAIKDDMPEMKEIEEVQKQPEIRLRDDVIFLIDDICPENLKYWKYMEELHQKYPNNKVIAFVIANNKNEGPIRGSTLFKPWYDLVKNWVEIGVHGWDHEKLQEGWREDQEKYIKMALDELRPYLPERFLYRAPGFRTLAKTEGILKKLGFTGIAHQARIKYFDTGEIKENIFNLHCSSNETFVNPITLWKRFL